MSDDKKGPEVQAPANEGDHDPQVSSGHDGSGSPVLVDNYLPQRTSNRFSPLSWADQAEQEDGEVLAAAAACTAPTSPSANTPPDSPAARTAPVTPTQAEQPMEVDQEGAGSGGSGNSGSSSAGAVRRAAAAKPSGAQPWSPPATLSQEDLTNVLFEVRFSGTPSTLWASYSAEAKAAIREGRKRAQEAGETLKPHPAQQAPSPAPSEQQRAAGRKSSKGSKGQSAAQQQEASPAPKQSPAEPPTAPPAPKQPPASPANKSEGPFAGKRSYAQVSRDGDLQEQLQQAKSRVCRLEADLREQQAATARARDDMEAYRSELHSTRTEANQLQATLGGIIRSSQERASTLEKQLDNAFSEVLFLREERVLAHDGLVRLYRYSMQLRAALREASLPVPPAPEGLVIQEQLPARPPLPLFARQRVARMLDTELAAASAQLEARAAAHGQQLASTAAQLQQQHFELCDQANRVSMIKACAAAAMAASPADGPGQGICEVCSFPEGTHSPSCPNRFDKPVNRSVRSHPVLLSPPASPRQAANIVDAAGAAGGEA